MSIDAGSPEGLSAGPRPLTQRDLDHTPDDGNLYEVIDGVLHVSPFPTARHQKTAGALFASLHAHVRLHRLGEVFPAGLKVVLDEPTGVGPDIVYISAARLADLRDDGFHGAPDLLVEVLSSRPMLDRQVKLHRYARAGVPHYWIADPVGHLLELYRLEGDHYRLVMTAKDAAAVQPELFPGLTLALDELWLF